MCERTPAARAHPVEGQARHRGHPAHGSTASRHLKYPFEPVSECVQLLPINQLANKVVIHHLRRGNAVDPVRRHPVRRPHRPGLVGLRAPHDATR